MYFAEHNKSAYYALANDIYFNSSENSRKNVYRAHQSSAGTILDGRNHTIHNLYIEDIGEGYTGLFNSTEGELFDLTLNNVTIKEPMSNSTQKNYSAFGKGYEFKNCKLTGNYNIVLSSEKNKHIISGIGSSCSNIYGCINNSKLYLESETNTDISEYDIEYSGIANRVYVEIKNCEVGATVDILKGNINGILNGTNAPILIDNCIITNSAKLISRNGSVFGIVGLLGTDYSAIKMSNCSNNGYLEGDKVCGILKGCESSLYWAEPGVVDVNHCETGENAVLKGKNVYGIAEYITSEHNRDIYKFNDCYNRANIINDDATIPSNIYGLFGTISGKGKITISNCVNYGNLNNLYNNNKSNTVGFCGILDTKETSAEILIQDCGNEGDIIASGDVFGLISEVGYEFPKDDALGKITISHCYNKGEITSKEAAGIGLVGTLYLGKLVNCYNEGTVKGDFAYGVMRNLSIGLVKKSSDFDVSNIINYVDRCYNSGNIEAITDASGIIGKVDFGKISSCYNTGKITGISGGISGLIGSIGSISNHADGYFYSCSNMTNVTVDNCYNSGKVDGSAGGTPTGLIGSISVSNSDIEIDLSNLYNVGTILYNTNKYGNISSHGSFTESIYAPEGLVKISNIYTLNGCQQFDRNFYEENTEIQNCTAYSVSDMKKQSSYIGFDFDNIWEMGQDDYPYPIFSEDWWDGQSSDATSISGTWENIQWSLDDGTLTISGSGEMPQVNEAKDIPWYAYRKKKIKKIVINEGITSISNYAFYDITYGKNVTIPQSVRTIGAYAFSASGLENLTLPNGISEIGKNAFSGCAFLKSLSLPDGITTVPEKMVSGCTRIKTLILPNTIKDIEPGFSGLPINLVVFNGTKGQWEQITSRTELEDTVKKNVGGIRFNNGYDGTFQYIDYSNKTAKRELEFKDELFFENSKNGYNHDLAILSLKTEMAAFGYSCTYDENNKETLVEKNHLNNDEKAKNIIHYMDQMGFEYTEDSIHYPEWNPNNYETIGYAIGSKDIYDAGTGKTASLILVAVRGAGYGYEWGSNLNVGNDTHHYGFDMAANNVYAGLKKYIQDKGYFQNDTKIWVVGYSRGAATANLVTAKIDNALASPSSEDYNLLTGNGVNSTGNGIFGYTFECPQNTTDKNVTNQKYSNIYNIINPMDLVPMVAPSANWGFTRYGKNLYYPAKSNSSSNYGKYKEEMLKVYRKMVDPVDNQEFADLVRFANSQEEVYEQLVKLLVRVLGKKEDYFFYFQNEIQKIAAATMVQGNIQEITADLLADIFLLTYTKSGDVGKLISAVTFNETSYKLITRGVTTGVVSFAVLHPNLSAALLKLSKSEIRNLLVDLFKPYGTAIAITHYPDLNLAWLESLDGAIVKSTKSKKKEVINCPVDVRVYDSQNRLVAEIIDEKETEIEDGIICYVDGDGQKVFITPEDEEYRFDICPRNDGTMTVAAYEYDANNISPDCVNLFRELELQENQKYEAIVDADSIRLAKSGGSAIVPERIDDVEQYNVSIESIGNGEVFGGGSYITGEFSQVIAKPMRSNQDFDGWYNKEGELLSTELTYRFLVTEDVELEARFADINGQLWIAGIDGIGYDYTGKPIKPVVTVYDGNTLLKEKVDYTISYKNNTVAHTVSGENDIKAPTVVVTGKGNYSSKETVTFNILQKNLSDEDIIIEPLKAIAKPAKVQKPVPTVMYGGKKLSLNKDFSIAYYKCDKASSVSAETLVTGCLEPGKYQVVLSGIGNYQGTCVTEFDIADTQQVSMSSLSVSKVIDHKYKGEPIELTTEELVVKEGTYVLKQTTKEEAILNSDAGDFYAIYQKNNAVGTVTVTLVGTGKKYVGKRNITFKIIGTPISKVQVYGIPKSVPYVEPSLSFKLEKNNGNEYTTGNIEGIHLSYNDGNQDYPLYEGKDYEVAYQNNDRVGTATVIFTGKGQYTGSIKKSFKITALNFSESLNNMTVSLSEKDANGVAFCKGGAKPKPIVTYNFSDNNGSHVTLKEGTDYTLKYMNNTTVANENAKNAKGGSIAPTIVVTGKGNYRGTVNKTFTILQKDMEKEEGMRLVPKDMVYKNKKGAWKCTVTVYDTDDKKLVVGKDYQREIVYKYKNQTENVVDQSQKEPKIVVRENNEEVQLTDIVPAGTEIVVSVIGMGFYTGKLEATYRIVQSDISKCKVSVAAKAYTGEEIKLNHPDVDSDETPDITLTLGTQKLTTKDYEILEDTYKNHKNKGKAQVTIKGAFL